MKLFKWIAQFFRRKPKPEWPFDGPEVPFDPRNPGNYRGNTKWVNFPAKLTQEDLQRIYKELMKDGGGI